MSYSVVQSISSQLTLTLLCSASFGVASHHWFCSPPIPQLPVVVNTEPLALWHVAAATDRLTTQARQHRANGRYTHLHPRCHADHSGRIPNSIDVTTSRWHDQWQSAKVVNFSLVDIFPNVHTSDICSHYWIVSGTLQFLLKETGSDKTTNGENVTTFNFRQRHTLLTPVNRPNTTYDGLHHLHSADEPTINQLCHLAQDNIKQKNTCRLEINYSVVGNEIKKHL